MDSATFLTILLILVSLTLLGVGAYLIFLIHEARESLKRVNRILDRTDKITGFIEEKVIHPGSTLATITSLIREAVSLVNDIKKVVENRNKESEQ
jgi:hypothetical protein